MSKKRGRPKEFGSQIVIRITDDTHDDLVAEALRRRIDVAQVARERLQVTRYSQLNNRLVPSRTIH